MKCPPNVLNKEGKEALLSCSDVSKKTPQKKKLMPVKLVS
jgi:hypothetical protein